MVNNRPSLSSPSNTSIDFAIKRLEGGDDMKRGMEDWWKQRRGVEIRDRGVESH